MSRPVIGITSYVEPASWSVWTDVPAALIPHGYVRHVHEAGGLAVVVPPLPDDATDDDARTVLSRLDGLILAGGVDVEPGRYGQQPHETVQLPRPDRDVSELRLANVTAADDFPVLGICRGMQVMAVAAGGILEQHLPERLGHHGHSPSPGMYGEHPVELSPGSRLNRILGDQVTVATYHHQGVAVVARLHRLRLVERRRRGGVRGRGCAVPDRGAVAPGGRRRPAAVRGPGRGLPDRPLRRRTTSDLVASSAARRVARKRRQAVNIGVASSHRITEC